MLVNEYRLKIKFKKVRNVRNINNVPMVGSRPLDFRPAQNVYAERTLHGLSFFLACLLYLQGEGSNAVGNVDWGE